MEDGVTSGTWTRPRNRFYVDGLSGLTPRPAHVAGAPSPPGVANFDVAYSFKRAAIGEKLTI